MSEWRVVEGGEYRIVDDEVILFKCPCGYSDELAVSIYKDWPTACRGCGKELAFEVRVTVLEKTAA